MCCQRDSRGFDVVDDCDPFCNIEGATKYVDAVQGGMYAMHLSVCSSCGGSIAKMLFDFLYESFLYESASQNACFMQHFAITSSHVRGSAAMQFLALEHFATHLNETFAVTLDSLGQTPFVLVEARPLPMTGGPIPGMVRAPFSLLFRNESAILLPQKIYQMTHVAMGEFGIFLVPIARDRDGFIYQAVFN